MLSASTSSRHDSAMKNTPWESRTISLEGRHPEVADKMAKEILAEHQQEILEHFSSSAAYLAYARAVASGRVRIYRNNDGALTLPN